MNRFDHRVVGAVSGAAYSAPLNLPLSATVACMWLSSTSSAGKTSPDVDQYPQWTGNNPKVSQWRWVPWLNKTLLKVGPNNHGEPIDHRRVTHWPGIPAAVALALAVVWQFLPPRSPVPPESLSEGREWVLAWLAYAAVVAVGALVAGWTSHLVGDWAFGKRSRYRGPGIPFAPWWLHKGLGLKSDGWPAHLATWLIFVPGGAATFLRLDVVEATARTCLGG